MEKKVIEGVCCGDCRRCTLEIDNPVSCAVNQTLVTLLAARKEISLLRSEIDSLRLEVEGESEKTYTMVDELGESKEVPACAETVEISPKTL